MGATGIAGLVVTFGVVGVSPASAKTALPLWSSASEVNVSGVGLVSLDCTSPGNCVAVGSNTFGSAPAVVTEAGGVWGHPSEVALPANATTPAISEIAGLDSVTCTSPGGCVAVGSYSDYNTPSSPADSQAMVVAENGGVWGNASELTLPANATPTAGAQHAALDSVTCTSRGNCVAVGTYIDSTGSGQAMVVAETGGAWGRASELTLPRNATTVPYAGYASLESVTCTSPGNCVAVGRYADTSAVNQAMVVAETRGVWGRASQVTLPANAIISYQDAALDSVTCTSPGDCVALGDYAVVIAGYGGFQAMVVAETRGVWGHASQVTLPANTPTIMLGSGIHAALESVTCPSRGNCVAVGHVDTSGPAMVVAETRGVWGQASQVTLPANAATTAVGQQSDLTSVTCTSPGSCVALGSYAVTVTAGGQPMTVNLVPWPQASVATVGNQRITLMTSSPRACTARAARLAVAFDSTAIPKSRGKQLRFSSAAFYIGKGIKHTRSTTVRTANGRKKHERVTVYLPDARTHHVSLRTYLSLAGLKAGTHTLKVVVSYRKTERKDGHTSTVLVTKTLNAKFSVC